MGKSKIFLILSLAFLGGIFCRSFFSGSEFVYIFLVMAVITATVFYKNKVILVVSFFVFLFIFGFWITDRNLIEIKSLDMDGKEIAEKVIVAKGPVKKEGYQSVIVKTEKHSNILINSGPYEDFRFGDELELNCTLKVPENKDRDFDYRMYLAKDGIFYVCQNASFKKTGNNRGNVIYKAMLNLKDRMSKNITRVLPQPESALANGLIFGGDSQLPKSVADNFSKTGLSHIVAVSGFNVTIIAEYLMIVGIFIGLWRKQAFWFAVAGIFLFVSSIGFPSSAVRAGIMGTLLIWAMKNGRLANSFNAIIFSACIMLMINPLLLRWDIGFQLSFLAALGIIMISPFWQEFVIRKNRVISEIQETIFLTISASVFVLPIILYNFHILSIISVFANVLVLPFIPLAMLLVFLTSVVGLISQIASLPFAWLAFLLLKYITEVVNYSANLEWSSITVENFNAEWLTVWYIVLIFIIICLRKNMNPKLKIINPKQNA